MAENTGPLRFVPSVLRLFKAESASPSLARGVESGRGAALGYSWALATMVLVSPVTWMHHDTWLLPAFIIASAYALRDLRGGLRDANQHVNPALYMLAAVLFGYVLTMNLLPFGYDGASAPHLDPYVGGHPLRPFLMLLRPLGTLLLWTATGALYLRAARPPTQPTDGEQVAASLRLLTAVLIGLLAAMVAVWTALLPIWYV